MAIKNENAYYKIVESTIDYINNRTTIVCDRYVDEADRIYEKNMKEQINNILNSDKFTHIGVIYLYVEFLLAMANEVCKVNRADPEVCGKFCIGSNVIWIKKKLVDKKFF